MTTAAKPPTPGYPTIKGHCIYCGQITRKNLCPAHTDLAANDPLLTTTTNTLPTRNHQQPNRAKQTSPSMTPPHSS
jgi:hypothetical protein